MHFLPCISLLTLRCFVAEVRWLFPVSRQKKRESGKQRNTEPWRWKLNENTAFSEISATCSSFNSKYLSKFSAVLVYCLFVLAFLFFLLWHIFLHLLTETGSNDEHSKNKLQNINCYKNNIVLYMLSRLCVSNGTPYPMPFLFNSPKIMLGIQSKFVMLCQKK